MKDNPLIQSLERLKQLDLHSENAFSDKDLNEMTDLLGKLMELCGNEEPGNASIATKNGGVELVCSVSHKVQATHKGILVLGLKTMALFIRGN